jgi:hypothetical protein
MHLVFERECKCMPGDAVASAQPAWIPQRPPAMRAWFSDENRQLAAIEYPPGEPGKPTHKTAKFRENRKFSKLRNFANF